MRPGVAVDMLTGADAGSRRVLETGKRVIIRLPENVTGFQWQLDLPDGLAVAEDRLLPAPPGSGIGGTGLHEYVLDVVGAVAGELRARLVQPWEPDVVAETWEVSVSTPR